MASCAISVSISCSMRPPVYLVMSTVAAAHLPLHRTLDVSCGDNWPRHSQSDFVRVSPVHFVCSLRERDAPRCIQTS